MLGNVAERSVALCCYLLELQSQVLICLRALKDCSFDAIDGREVSKHGRIFALPRKRNYL